MSDLYEFVNGIELDPIYVCDPNKSPCRCSELCHKPGGCFYTLHKDRALDPSTPLYMAESLKKVDKGLPAVELHNLRAEIEELDVRYVIGAYPIYRENGPKYVQLTEVLQIIDKYIERSEE